jgi:hypothetical protein
MSAPQLHLLINHVPVIGIWFAAATLAIGLASRNRTVARLGVAMLLFLALAGIPVFLSGEPSEHVIEHAAGVSEHQIHEHEDMARVSFIGLGFLGLLALWSLVRHRGADARRGFLTLLLLLTVALGGVLGVTAHRGGLIRHPELRPDFATPSAPEHDRD